MEKKKVSSEMIKELREKTGIGMSKCKNALVRADGSIEKAIEILRKEGEMASIKKSARTAKEGLIGCMDAEDKIGLIEVNCETDFVAQNERFKVFTSDLANQIALSPASKEEFLKQKFIADESMTVEECKNNLIQKFGENIQIKRVEVIDKNKDYSYGIYIHMGGKIVTVVEVEGDSEEMEMAKNIAMHVAASSPEYVSREKVQESVLEKEKEIIRSQIKNKPEHILEKIVDGKLQNFFENFCLLDQKYVKNTDITVKQYVEQYSISKKKTLSIKRFWYWKVGV